MLPSARRVWGIARSDARYTKEVVYICNAVQALFLDSYGMCTMILWPSKYVVSMWWWGCDDNKYSVLERSQTKR